MTDYFIRKWSSNERNRLTLPSYMPVNGLLFYDDLTSPRRFAVTGQRLSERDPGTSGMPNDPLEYTTIGGKRCLYKESQNNGLSFKINATSMTDYSWGCWVYDATGSTTQLVFVLEDVEGNNNALNFYVNTGTNRARVEHYVKSTNKTGSSYYDNVHVQGEWKLFYAWHGAGYFGIRQPPKQDGANLGSAPDSRIVLHKAVLLYPGSCQGVAIRGAFLYNRVLTTAEGMAIYNGGKDET